MLESGHGRLYELHFDDEGGIVAAGLEYYEGLMMGLGTRIDDVGVRGDEHASCAAQALKGLPLEKYEDSWWEDRVGVSVLEVEGWGELRRG